MRYAEERRRQGRERGRWFRRGGFGADTDGGAGSEDGRRRERGRCPGGT